MSPSTNRPRPKRVASFDVLREIGQGGMGQVYEAFQPALDRHVVLKKIRRELVGDETVVERFQREARAAAAVHHQNVVAVYDGFEHRGDLYIAQEFVNGVDLRAILEEAGKLEPHAAALICLQVTRGLEEIHSQSIVHRDIKPGNILVGRNGEIKIADFGIALENDGESLTRPGFLVGSIPYMSPEQLVGENVDTRSDLFLLGVLLYELLTGRTPYRQSTDDSRDTLLERMQAGRYIRARKLAPAVPFHLDRLIRRCLQARPARRIQSATAVRRHLERHLPRVSPADCRMQIATYMWDRGLLKPNVGVGSIVRPAPSPWYQQPGWAGRRGLVAGAAGVAASALVLTGVWMGRDPAVETTAAVPEPARVVASLDPAAMVPVDGEANMEESSDLPAGTEALTEPPVTTPAPALAPAEVRFTAYPWAEVQVDDGEPFLTPRATPIELSPGSHRVTFVHPTFGAVAYDLDLAEGEDRVVSHVYEQAP